uniref:Uncharacterized protein n=1 Tax=Arundo donax TaxID=35708 RepID=A0A0A9AT48_ARUDO
MTSSNCVDISTHHVLVAQHSNMLVWFFLLRFLDHHGNLFVPVCLCSQFQKGQYMIVCFS